MPRTPSRLTAMLASGALAASGLVAAGGSLAPVAASTLDPLAPVTIDAATAASSSPAAAAPGTLLFIKNFNVWMSRGDGSGQIQVTTDASSFYSSYRSPSMSSDGVITALQTKDVVRLRTDGTELSRWDTGDLLPPSESGIQHTTGVHASPDGTKVAYDQTALLSDWSVAVGTRFSASDRWTDGGEQELSRSGPKWVSNSRVVLRAWSTIYLRDVAASESVPWFEDEEVFPIGPDCTDLCWAQEQWSPELSRDGSRLVTMRGMTSDPDLVVYTVTGDARTGTPGTPAAACRFNGEGDEEFDNPTIGPNNRSIAWQMTEGIYVKTSMDSCEVDDVALAVPGGSEPSWSAVAYKVPSAPKPDPKPDPKPGDQLVVTAAPVVRGVAKVGKKLKASAGSWKPAAKKITYQWKRNGKAIKKATKATYKLKKADAGKKITVTVTANRSGYKKASATSKARPVAAFNTKKPKIKKKNTAKVGKRLKVTKGKWKGKPRLSYQWFRGKKKIKGATKARYKVKKADRGKRLRVKVTAKRPGAPKVTITTTRTKKVK